VNMSEEEIKKQKEIEELGKRMQSTCKQIILLLDGFSYEQAKSMLSDTIEYSLPHRSIIQSKP